MKSTEYNTFATSNKDALLACKCDCQCGASGVEAVVCVHILPLIFQLALLLVQGIAENILLELHARFDENVEDKFCHTEIKCMKNSVQTLMIAVMMIYVINLLLRFYQNFQFQQRGKRMLEILHQIGILLVQYHSYQLNR